MKKIESCQRPDSGKRRSVVLVAVLAGTAVSAGVNDIEDLIARCASHAVKDERIGCLERGLRQMAHDDTGIPTTGSGAAHRTEKETSENTFASASSQPAAPARSSPSAGAGGNGSPATQSPAEPLRDSEGARRSEMDELGAEQVARRSEPGPPGEEAPVAAMVVAFNVVGYRKLLFELDNGQIWRQTNGDRADVTRDLRDKRTFDVELRRTGLGGYRMYIVPLDRTIRVERLK